VDHGLISEKQRGFFAKSAKLDRGLILKKQRGFFAKCWGIFRLGIIFQRINLWADAGVDRGHGGALTGAWPPAAPVRQSSPAGAQNGEGSTGSSAQASPELGRCCGGRAMVVQNREAAVLGDGTAQAWREGKGSGERCGVTQGWCSPFIGPGECWGGNAGG
jgi:hypothetical protein